MSPVEILNARVNAQSLAGNQFHTPEQLLSLMGAMKAQEFGQSKWAVGSRLISSLNGDVEKAINEKKILRTWPMRGTWHLILPEDVRWMISLCTPRLISSAGARYRELELDALVLNKCYKIFEKTLVGGTSLLREDLSERLADSGIEATGIRLTHIIQRAVWEKLITPTVRAGAEFTFGLLDEWVPKSSELSREESLHKLATYYFQSRGPATVRDFSWWTGLNLGDCKSAIASVKELSEISADGNSYLWKEIKVTETPELLLLSAFDEYLLAFSDRSLMLRKEHVAHVATRNGIFNPILVVNGRVAGIWKRVEKKDRILITISSLLPFTKKLRSALDQELERLGKFYNKPCSVEIVSIK